MTPLPVECVQSILFIWFRVGLAWLDAVDVCDEVSPGALPGGRFVKFWIKDLASDKKTADPLRG